MGSDMLSQAELESLLSEMSFEDDSNKDALSGSVVSDSPRHASEVASGIANPAANMDDTHATQDHAGEKITSYGFRQHPQSVVQQFQTLQKLHEGFALNSAAGLSAMLRSPVEIKLTGIECMKSDEFFSGLENPTCLNLLKAEPLKGHAILEINYSILLPVIDRLLGGRYEGGTLSSRPLTEIELRIVSRITELLLAELRTAWKEVHEFDLEVSCVESNPQQVHELLKDEVVVSFSFTLTIGKARGTMNICMPYSSVGQIGDELLPNGDTSPVKQKQTSPKNAQKNTKTIVASPVEICVQLAQTRITADELKDLRVGDLITTDHDINRPLVATVDSVPKFHVLPGACKGRKAVCVQEPLEEPTTNTED